MATATSTPLLDDQWIVAIANEIEAMLCGMADVTDAYTVGCTDAEAGEPCEPLVHYAKLGDIENYICGWKDATVAMEEAADLREDMEDRAYHARGGW